ncbi:Rrf2 family transcriptional regulator [bacterium]|nr:Rrf2 family transcriptional regulator [bacterium]
MLRITKAEDQAVRLVMQLATSGEQLTLGQLAEREALPEPTVAKLLGQLRRGGVVEAIRGRHGGYTLAGTPDEISAGQVLRALGSDPAPDHPCVVDPSNGGDCPRTEDCGLRAVWRHLQIQVNGLLEKTTIADLLRVEDNVGGRLHQLWPREDGGSSETPAPNAYSEGA